MDQWQGFEVERIRRTQFDFRYVMVFSLFRDKQAWCGGKVEFADVVLDSDFLGGYGTNKNGFHRISETVQKGATQLLGFKCNPKKCASIMQEAHSCAAQNASIRSSGKGSMKSSLSSNSGYFFLASPTGRFLTGILLMGLISV
jgi:hypothetical protein